MDNLNRHFGLVIAYLLPGFIALVGIVPFQPVVGRWLRAGEDASLGAPLYALLAATAAGMIASCVRWLLVDHVHAATGLGDPRFNPRALEERPAAFTYLVENHYRYYQFYANALVAIVFSYTVTRWSGTAPGLSISTDVGVVLVCAALFVGSRDALRKYRERIRALS